MHPGTGDIMKEEKRQYLLSNHAYKTRHAQLSQHEALLSLRDEISLIKTLIEARFNAIKVEADLIAACLPLNQMLVTLERLIRSCQELERNVGSVLTKEALHQLARELVSILLDELRGVPNYEFIIDRVSARIVPAITEARNLPGK